MVARCTGRGKQAVGLCMSNMVTTCSTIPYQVLDMLDKLFVYMFEVWHACCMISRFGLSAVPVMARLPTMAQCLLCSFPKQGLGNRCKKELGVIGQQYPFEQFQWLPTSLRLTFEEGISMLQDAGYDVSMAGSVGCWPRAPTLARLPHSHAS